MAGDTPTPEEFLTFSQSEGLEPLPRQLKKDEMPRKLRARLWLVISHILNGYKRNEMRGPDTVNSAGRIHIADYYVSVKGQFADDVPDLHYQLVTEFRSLFENGAYNRIFDFIQFMLDRQYFDDVFIDAIDNTLAREKCAYRIVDRRRLVPVGSQIDAETITAALEVTKKGKFVGARAHIENAIDCLNNDDNAGSIRESISAVESISKVLADSSKAELSKALGVLETRSSIHGGMRAAFLSLYGYASDEKGIRHSLLFKDKADVDQTDALFMIGACSAFVTYLINRTMDLDTE